ncbi:hypothetical protein GE061_006197 [Apolygus lucorum]|uniref:Small ribosomal subunit protein mS26 n=1 Tax=Apolygus lucorum TaxID=248454 RepID=A0A6A4IY23_APOLU|nr:hypothetical protein GE061_006197 [Apolygus lucorum]
MSPSPFSQVQVRWRKKPRWLPVAKSKMFKVPERKRPPSDEHEELKRLHNQYRTEMKSLRLFFSERTKAMSTGEEVLAEIAKREEDAHQEAVRINAEWNARVAEHREKLLAEEKEREVEEILEAVEKARKAALEMKMKAEEIVRQEKERAKNYITPENIDEAINKALDNPVDHEFAIDLDENIIKGRRTKPVQKEQEEIQKVAMSA